MFEGTDEVASIELRFPAASVDCWLDSGEKLMSEVVGKPESVSRSLYGDVACCLIKIGESCMASLTSASMSYIDVR